MIKPYVWYHHLLSTTNLYTRPDPVDSREPVSPFSSATVTYIFPSLLKRKRSYFMNIKIPLTKELSNFILRNILPFFFFNRLCSFNTWDTYTFICKFSFSEHVSELFPLPSIVLIY